MANVPPSLADAQRFLALLARPGDVFELRGLGKNVDGRPHVMTGYFDNIDELVKAAAERSGKDIGVYVTLNPVLPALLARAPKNKVRRAGNGDTTSDRDVRVRRSILVDVDPVRPQGISSTDEEHAAAIDLARHIADELTMIGWPVPIVADSGNGGHLIYAVDLPVEDGGLVKRVLAKLSEQFSTTILKIDEKVFNPARISKIYGTLTKKGEDVVDRPHRLARLISAPPELEVATREMLDAFAPLPKPRTASGTHPPPSRGEQRFDIDAFIAAYLPDAIAMSWSEGRKWILPVCPFNDAHDRREAFICEKHSGQLSAGCLHDSCKWQWEQLRGHFEPDYADRRRRYESGNGTNGHRVSNREEPPEVVYQDPDWVSDVDSAADRDREPPTKPVPWKLGPAIVDEIWDRRDEPWVTLKLGPDDLCRVRAGGIAVVMGGSGSGKSSLVSNMLMQHARDAGPAIAMSIELPADELAARIVGIRCDSGWEAVLRGQVKREFLVDALALPRLYVLERKHATLENLATCIDAARADHPGEPILVGIDYAQLIHSKEREVRLRVADAFERIDDVSREKRVVSIAVSQMGRSGAKAARDGDKVGAESADLGAESAAIERFASVTLSIGKQGEPREDGSKAVELSIGKGRMSDAADSVRPASYWGRSGLWRIAGDAIAADKVRADRETGVALKKQTAAELTMLGAAQKSAGPLTKEDLCELVVGNAQMKRAAVAALIARGDLVEVRQRRARSRSWLLWSPDRAVDAGLQLVRDMPESGD